MRELFNRHPENPILTPDMWPYPVNSVFNPGVTRIKNKVLLLVRVEDRTGISHLTVAKSKDGIKNWEIDKKPTFLPKPENYPEERWGVEDPRITYLEDEDFWVITYTSFSKFGPLVSLAKTNNFKKLKRLGIIFPPQNKDSALFPVKFAGEFAILHRPQPVSSEFKTCIWISFSPNLIHWGKHKILFSTDDIGIWDSSKIGICAPPLKTKDGWLILYHGVKETASGAIYRLGLALLDLEDPTKIISRSNEWIFGPKENYERKGDVGNVVFSCGWLLEDNGEIKLYYGAGDTYICLATGYLSEILEYLKKYKDKK